MKCKEIMTHILFDTMPSWMKYQNEKDFRTVRKVYSIGDLRYVNDSDLLSSSMSKLQFEKMKQNLPSSSNLTLSNSALGKLLVRKFTQRSTVEMTRSTIDLSSNYEQQDSSITIIEKNIQFIERIDEGKFGTVFKANYRTKQNELLTVAVKKLDQEFDYNDISKEVNVLRDIKHPHIVHFFGIVFQTDNSIMFVTEYAPCKSLYQCLISKNAKFEYSIKTLLEFLKQITSAMSYLEKKFFIHRNISCRNFLVFNKSLIKLSDLGYCHVKDKLKLSIAWMSPEIIHFQRFTTASDVFAFGVSMWECFTYGQIPWKGMANDEIINVIDAPNHQRLPRPPYATSEFYQLMLHCWKYETSERPTFSQLEKTLAEIELKQVRWKENNNNNKSLNLPDGFLSIESCLLGPLTILDRCLNVPISSSAFDEFIQCLSVDGHIGFVYNNHVEPLHIISISKPISTTMNHLFHRKTVIKKNSTKTKSKQISKDMIGAPQSDFIHACHIGVSGETFGDVTCFAGIEKSDLSKESESNSKQPIATVINDKQTSSLFDEVMQAFTDIYSESESTSVNSPSIPIDINQSRSNDPTESGSRSPPLSRLLSKLTTTKSSCRFTRELEQRLQNGDLSEQGKHAYNLLINRYTSNSSSTYEESSTSSSSQEKSDCHSHYSSISTDNDDNRSISSLNSRDKSEQHSITGQPLPPPPDLSSLGSKLTTATITQTFKLPVSLTSNKYRTKKRFNIFA